MGNNLPGSPASKIYDSKHISAFATINSITRGDHRTTSLMLLNSLAPAFLPHYQFPSDAQISVCNSTPMSLRLGQINCGMPPSIKPSDAPPLRQPFTDDIPILLLIQPKNPPKQDAETLQPPLDLHLFNIRSNVYKLITRRFNSSINT